PSSPAAARPKPSVDADHQSRLNITVVFTSVDATVAALKKAGRLAESLGARITLLVPQVVPYPCPLADPPVSLDFQERRFCEIAAESPVEIHVQLYLCRDSRDVLKRTLKPKSLIVLGGRRRWWPTREWRLARKLRGEGHEVVFTEVN